MKKLVATIAAVVACGSLFAEGNEVTWTGNGATAAWNDPDNWSAVPQEGDTAVFSEGTVTATTGDLETFGLFSGFRIETGATLLLSKFNGTFDQTLTGGGNLAADGAFDHTKIITFKADASLFTGTFAFTNHHVDLYAPLGTTNDVFVTVAAGVSDVACPFGIELKGGAPAVMSNAFYFVGNSSKAPVLFNHYLTSGVTLAGPVKVVSNNVALRLGGTDAYGITIAGGITGGGTLLTLGGGWNATVSGKPVRMDVKNVSAEAPNYADLGGNLFGDAGNFIISTVIESAYLNADPGSFRFDADHCSTTNTHWGFSLGQHDPGTYDLNGHDQDCGNMHYLKGLPTETNPKMIIKSEEPATLTMHGRMQHVYQTSTDPVNKRRRFAGLLNGAVTFVFKSDLLATPAEINFLGAGSSTSGGIVSLKGTVNILADATFTNLTLLAAQEQGKLNLETAEIGTLGKGLTVKASDSATMTINGGLVLQAKYAFLGDKWVEAGDYGGPDAGLDEKHTCANLAGTGIVRVAEYGGPKGLMLLVR